MIMLFISIHRSIEFITLITFPNIDLILYFCYKNTIGYDVLGFFFFFWGEATEFYFGKILFEICKSIFIVRLNL